MYRSTFLLCLALAAPALAQGTPGTNPAQPYAGQHNRAIKALSEDDIAELRRGGGWGLAKPVELNGMPGPAHLLQMKDEIGLSADQVAQIQAIFDRMEAEAIAEGARLIDAEARLDAAFRDRTLTDESLKAMLAESEAIRARLRYIHLSTHRMTPALLSADQIARYNELRGYGSDPCAAVLAGHNPAMWRKHNGCK